MSAYRIYELTADNHVAAPASTVDCHDDAAAIQTARQRLDHRILEVWQLDRCVIRMQPMLSGVGTAKASVTWRLARAVLDGLSTSRR